LAQPYTTYQFLDRSGEKSSLKMYLPDVTNVNYATTVVALSDIRVALLALTLCSMGTQSELVCEVHSDVATLPSDPYAQRESRAMFSCADAVTGRQFKIGVPCPDLGDMGIPGTDAVNLSDVEVAAYVTALGLWSVSPEGNAYSVIRGQVQGRNV